jgi:hypothetical protein
MANDRMFIYHPATGSSLYIGKVFGEEWYYGVGEDDLPKKLDNFYMDCGYSPECSDFIIVNELQKQALDLDRDNP